MKKSIFLRKPIMVEGKIISKGAKIFVESDDVEDVGVVDTEEDIDYDLDKAKRLARIRRLRAMKRVEDDADEKEEEDSSEDSVAEKKARLARIRRLRAMKRAEGETSVEEDDDGIVAEKCI